MRDVGQQLHPDLERILHDDDVDEGEVLARARAEIATDEVDLIGDVLRAARQRPLVEERGGEVRHAALALGILRRAGAHEQPDADSAGCS